jgi:hypothetical protein
MTSKPSLQPDYFDAIYQRDPDPWQFATSEYEAGKYRATLAALPRKHYRNGFEVGCSIGVLTRMLAERCDDLLAPTSPTARWRRPRRTAATRRISASPVCRSRTSCPGGPSI